MAWFYPCAAPTFSPVFANDMLFGLGRNAAALTSRSTDDRQGDLGPRWTERHHQQGHQLLGERQRQDRRLIFAVDSFLQQIDANTGKSILTFGDNGISDMQVGLLRAEGTSVRAMPASPGRIWRNIMVFGGQSGRRS